MWLLRSRLIGQYLAVAAMMTPDTSGNLFVMARGALQLDFQLGKPFEDFVARIEARPAVQAALARETAADQTSGTRESE